MYYGMRCYPKCCYEVRIILSTAIYFRSELLDISEDYEEFC